MLDMPRGLSVIKFERNARPAMRFNNVRRSLLRIHKVRRHEMRFVTSDVTKLYSIRQTPRNYISWVWFDIKKSLHSLAIAPKFKNKNLNSISFPAPFHSGLFIAYPCYNVTVFNNKRVFSTSTCLLRPVYPGADPNN